MYAIDQLEDAIVTTLANAGLSARPFNRTPDATEFERELREEPAVLVVFERSETAKVRTVATTGTDFIFRLFVIARNLRGEKATARGDASSSGIYAVLESVRSALTESTFGLQVQPAVRLSERHFLRNARYAAYEQLWKITAFEQGA